MKNIILVGIFVLLLTTCVSAALTSERSSYKLGETVLVKASFNYPPDRLSSEHVKLYDPNGKLVLIPLYLVKFSDSLYYVYFQLPSILNQNKYTLKIGPYYYVLNNELQRVTEQIDIPITGGRNSIISVDPGAAVININNQNYFYVEIKNNGDNNVDLTMNMGEAVLNYYNYNIGTKDSLKLKGTVNTTGEKTLQIAYGDLTYKIPILVTGKVATISTPAATIPTLTKTPIDAIKFIENLDKINISVTKDFTASGMIRFKNFLTQDVTNLKISLSSDLADVITLNQTSYSVIKPNEINSIYLWINKNKDISKDYAGALKLTADNGISVSYPVYVYYKEEQLVEQETGQPIEKKTEEEFVTEKQITDEKKELNQGILFSLLTIVFVIIIILIIILKSKKRKPKAFIFSR